MPNVFAHLILATMLWAGSSLWSAGQCREPDAPPTPLNLDVTRAAGLSPRLRSTIAPGTYLYQDKIVAADAGGRELPLNTPSGETKHNPILGPNEIYYGAAEAVVPGAALAGIREVRITYQACAENGICYAPVTRVVEAPALDTEHPDGGEIRTEGGLTVEDLMRRLVLVGAKADQF